MQKIIGNSDVNNYCVSDIFFSSWKKNYLNQLFFYYYK